MSEQCSREVYCEDALPWLEKNTPLEGCSLITSLPDTSGLPDLSFKEWRAWFIRAAVLTLTATPDDGVTIFYQTDIKIEGTWVDKSFLLHLAAEEAGSALLWHKIACRKPPGTAAFGRPGYGHLLCYSRGVRDVVKTSYTDVLESTGEMTWSQAMGMEVCELACKYVKSHTTTQKIVDPFCGYGTVLSVANRMGMDAIGVEIGKRRARKARVLDAF